MTSILFLTEAIYCNIFRSKYLRKEKYFLIFFLLFFFFAFSNFTFNFEDFQKRDDPRSWCIFEFTNSEKGE